MPRLDAAGAVTILLRQSADVQAALGENTAAGAGARIQGAAPKEGYVPPWIWIEDRGGAPLDRTMGGDWTLRRDAVAIHVIGKDAERAGDIVATVEAALDNVCGESIALAGYTPIEVDWVTISTPGDERFEDEPDGVARSLVATVTSRKNF